MRNGIAFWLQQHCSLHRHTVHGAVLLRRDDALHLSASWPQDQALPSHLGALTQLGASAVAKRSVVRGEGQDTGGEALALLAHPLEASGVMVGVAVLAVRTSPQTLSDTELDAWQASAARFARVLAAPAPATKRQTEVDDPAPRVLALVNTAMGEAQPERAATALCTALAAQFACDRVTLGLRDGDTTQVIASSDGQGQALHAGARRVALQERLAALDEAMDGQASLIWPPPADAPPLISAAHAALARAQGLGALCTLPLVWQHGVMGAITLERARDQAFDAASLAVLEGLSKPLGAWFDQLQTAAQPWHRRAHRRVQAWTHGMQTEGHGRIKLAAVALGALMGVLMLSPTAHQVHAQARLEGTVQRVVSAPGDGYLKAVHVRPGDTVNEGDVLVEFAGEDLQLERRQRDAERSAAETSAGDAMARQDLTQLAVHRAQAEALRAQVALLDQKLARAQVRAPFDAVVISGDLTQTLGAPVKQGDMLMTLAPSQGFRAVVEVEDADIGTLRIGQGGSMVLTARPNDAVPLRVERITPLATPQAGRNVFEVEVSLQADTDLALQHALRPGMRGVARLHVGDAPRAVLWTRDALAWLRLSTWRWLG